MDRWVVPSIGRFSFCGKATKSCHSLLVCPLTLSGSREQGIRCSTYAPAFTRLDGSHSPILALAFCLQAFNVSSDPSIITTNKKLVQPTVYKVNKTPFTQLSSHIVTYRRWLHSHRWAELFPLTRHPPIACNFDDPDHHTSSRLNPDLT